jgi:heme oxygenase
VHDDIALSTLLRSTTAEAHQTAERTGVMAQFLRRTLPRDGYVALLRALYVIYDALERGAAAHRSSRVIATLFDPALARADALAADLTTFAGADWRALPVAPTAARYAARLDELAAHHPQLLVAHAYVRYLGDLHGGQVLGKLVRAQYDVTDADGARFYDVSAVGELHPFIARFRASLDAVTRDPAERDAIAAEALHGFREHITLFAELAA